MSTVIGNKWGGGRDGMPGGTVTWSFATGSSQTDRRTFQEAITGDLQVAVRDAFARWASVAQIDFVEVPFSSSSDITIGFYEMDGNGPQWGLVTYSTLAANTGRGDNHASFIHATIHLDGAENWSNKRDNYSEGVPLYLASLKQIGSAIGLDNSTTPGSVMNTILWTTTHDLSQEDIAAVRDLYGSRILPIAPSEHDDVFYSTPANDVVDGRGGFDIMVYEGERINFTIKRSADKITVIGHGQDELRNVEALHFDDGVLSFDTLGIPGMVYRVYQAAFDREPDTLGLSYWIRQMEAGKNMADMTDGFVASDEFASIYGSHPSNEDFIARLYFNVLGREGEQEGIDFWMGQMHSGWSKAWVLSSFANGAENIAGVANSVFDGIWYV